MAAVLGMGLDCALGRTLGECVAALRTDVVPCGTIELDAFRDPVRAAYYHVDDGADALDPGRMQRLLPPVVEAALTQAGLSPEQRRELPVFVGSSSFCITEAEARYAAQLRAHPDAAMPMAVTGFETIGRVAARTAESHGECFAWNTACTSAANALLAAQRMLAAGRFEHALVVGVELANRTSLSGFTSLQLLADAVRPFDVARAGLVLGEAVGAIVLGRASGTASMCLTGGAANSDPHSVTGANPDGSSMGAVQAQALARARRTPAEVRAIKSHATGSSSNDLGEARGMHRVFPTLPPVCALKPRLGHTLGACGVVELVLFAGALGAGFVPATPGFTESDPALDVRPLRKSMVAGAGTYLCNQFGFGGNNTSLVLEVD